MNDDKKMRRDRGTTLNNQRRFYGVGLVVAVMRGLDVNTRKELQAGLEQNSPELAKLIDKCDFLYPDLIRLDDASLLTVINRFPEQDWAIAWKLTEESLRRRILAVMRHERQQAFLDFAASLPRMPKMQVVAVQITLAAKIRELLQQGIVRAMNPLTVERERLTK